MVRPQFLISNVIDEARKSVALSINCIMTAAYWLIGRRIVEFDQGGKARAQYGKALLAKLSDDLTRQYGRGFGMVNLSQMKKFYLLWAPERIFQTVSEKLLSEKSTRENRTILQTLSEKSQPSSNIENLKTERRHANQYRKFRVCM